MRLETYYACVENSEYASVALRSAAEAGNSKETASTYQIPDQQACKL